VVVDGFIAGSAALAAIKAEPAASRCLFWSHAGEERGMGPLLRAAGVGALRPPLDMGLRLGEGTGAVLALPLLRCAAAVLREMAALRDVVEGGRA
jgi:nicotinate-nucleotide--dimethylbenzimidazole phosphoribosyltransferase